MNSIKRYLKFVSPYKLHIIVTIIVGVIKFAIPLITPLLLKYVIDDVINGGGTATEKVNELLIVMGIVFFIFAVLRPPIEYFRQYFAQWVGSRVLYDVRNNLFDHLQKLSLKYYTNTKTGEVISRIINDVEQTKDFVITGLMNIWLDMITVIIALTVMFTMDVQLTFVSMIILPLYIFFVKYFFTRLRKVTKDRSEALALMQGFLHERVQGIAVTRSFALEDYEQGQFDNRNKEFLDKAMTHTKWNAKTFAAINTITDIGPLLVIGFAAYQVIHGNLTLGAMVAFIGYIDQLYAPLRRLSNSSTTLTQAFASMDRVFELMDEKYDIQDKEDAVVMETMEGSVEFSQVSFRYNQEDEEVLRNISFEIDKGEVIAFVGGSGGGKSSLVSLIPRFYDTTGGKILIDGKNIRDYQVRSLREHIGMVLQDTILFSESIAENIRYGNPSASDEEVMEAAKKAHAHEFILGLSNGYDTVVGERGVKLSGGQRQRIAIARVFLKNPRLLILDEATSALDLENESYIQQALHDLSSDRTTIIIAHRLSTITHVDRIFYVDSGQITESGSHEELMNKRGAYYDLYSIQSLEYGKETVDSM